MSRVLAGLTMVVASVIVYLATVMLYDWCPRLAERLVRRAARRHSDSDPLEEELLAELAQLEGRKLSMLISASWIFLWAFLSLPSERRRQARVTTGRRGPSVLRWGALLLCGSVRRVRYSATLAERLVGYAVAWLPELYQEQYQAEWLGELDWLKAQRRPLLGWAVGVLSTSARTCVELRARLTRGAARVRALPRSPLARTIGRHRPLGFGVLTAAGVFSAAAAGWSGGPQSPSRAQVVWAILASLLAGAVATWQAWPRGPAPEEHDHADEPDRPAHR